MKKQIFTEIISVVVPIIFLAILIFDFNIENDSYIIYIILNLLFLNYSFFDDFRNNKKNNDTIKYPKLSNLLIIIPILCTVFILIIELLINNDSKVFIFKMISFFNMLAMLYITLFKGELIISLLK
jgi:hypothetical protein